MSVICDVFHPFDAGAGSNVLEDRWRDMARHWLRSGPIQGELNGFEVYADSTGMQVKVKTGKAWIAGHYTSNAAEKTLPIATYVSARYDLVILRADFTNNRCELEVLQGSGGVSVPALTQNTTIWEIALALIVVDTGATIAAGKVGDWRQYAAGTGSVGKAASSAVPPSTTGLGTPVDGDLSYELDTNRLRVYEGALWRWIAGKIVGAQILRNTTVTLTSGNWTQPSMSDNYDPDSIHAGTDNYVTIGEAGVYQVSVRAEFGASSTGVRAVGIHVGASPKTSTTVPTDILQLVPAASTPGDQLNGSDEVNVAAGDVISFSVMSTGATTGLDLLSARMTLSLKGYRT